MRGAHLAALGLLWAGPASAHAFLRTSTPAVGATLSQPPTQVVIGFTEAVEPAFCSIAVQDSGGGRVDDGAAHLGADDSHLAVGLKPLLPGRYKVTWHATATDTHHTQGTYTFTVAP